VTLATPLDEDRRRGGEEEFQGRPECGAMALVSGSASESGAIVKRFCRILQHAARALQVSSGANSDSREL
jgi:hypothetical protein